MNVASSQKLRLKSNFSLFRDHPRIRFRKVRYRHSCIAWVHENISPADDNRNECLGNNCWIDCPMSIRGIIDCNWMRWAVWPGNHWIGSCLAKIEQPCTVDWWWPISDWSTSWLSGILWLLVSSINWSVVGRVSIRFHLCSACLIQSPCIDVGRWIDLKWWLVSNWFGRRRWLYEKADHTGLTFTQLSDALYETVGPELTDPSTRPLLLLLPPPQRLSSSVRWRIGWSDDVSIRSHYSENILRQAESLRFGGVPWAYLWEFTDSNPSKESVPVIKD